MLGTDLRKTTLPGRLARKNILAHRGMWGKGIDKNSKEALSSALLSGFGIETDIRDLDGRLVISHDPPISSDDVLSFEWLLDLYASNACNGVLALNIKADGLSSLSQRLLNAYGVVDYFMFDMSIPDMLPYVRNGMTVYTRVSEYEPEPAMIAEVSGIWLDNFTGTFPQLDVAAKLEAYTKPIAVVSPELHKRPHEPFWTSMRDRSGLDFSSLLLCTDFPEAAADFFGGEEQ